MDCSQLGAHRSLLLPTQCSAPSNFRVTVNRFTVVAIDAQHQAELDLRSTNQPATITEATIIKNFGMLTS